MKFVAAFLVTTVIATALTAGLVLLSHHHPLGWPVMLGTFAGFMFLFVRYGCRGH